jgi:cytochrome P450
MTEPNPLPTADGPTGLEILKGLLRERSLLTALDLMRKHVGRTFQITLPRFQPAVMVGPETNRQVLVTERDRLLWRNDNDPVTKLLREGILVVDGEQHDQLRGLMDPYLQRRRVLPHIPAFWQLTDQVVDTWQDGRSYDMLVEMRKLALLVLFGTLFDVDFTPVMEQLWQPILDLIEYISPGWWIIFPNMPRHRKYQQAQAEMDAYLYDLIRARRAALAAQTEAETAGDLLSALVARPELSDDQIRDQLLTMLIAGHDTSTALLAWSLYLLGSHPQAMQAAQNEVDAVLGTSDLPPDPEQVSSLVYLDQVVKEALRLYPPIHIGNRRVAEDMVLYGYQVPADTRLMYSIYLSHRDETYWQDPASFCPERFHREAESQRPPLTYVPFGGGPRNCIGAAFAQIEARVILGRLLQRFNLELLNGDQIRPYMGATLEPRPGVNLCVRWRLVDA